MGEEKDEVLFDTDKEIPIIETKDIQKRKIEQVLFLLLVLAVVFLAFAAIRVSNNYNALAIEHIGLVKECWCVNGSI